jgi:hypothetical protein
VEPTTIRIRIVVQGVEELSESEAPLAQAEYEGQIEGYRKETNQGLLSSDRLRIVPSLRQNWQKLRHVLVQSTTVWPEFT